MAFESRQISRLKNIQCRSCVMNYFRDGKSDWTVAKVDLWLQLYSSIWTNACAGLLISPRGTRKSISKIEINWAKKLFQCQDLKVENDIEYISTEQPWTLYRRGFTYFLRTHEELFDLWLIISSVKIS